MAATRSRFRRGGRVRSLVLLVAAVLLMATTLTGCTPTYSWYGWVSIHTYGTLVEPGKTTVLDTTTTYAKAAPTTPSSSGWTVYFSWSDTETFAPRPVDWVGCWDESRTVNISTSRPGTLTVADDEGQEGTIHTTAGNATQPVFVDYHGSPPCTPDGNSFVGLAVGTFEMGVGDGSESSVHTLPTTTQLGVHDTGGGVEELCTQGEPGCDFNMTLAYHLRAPRLR